jgi:predicted polyphosphate/ATP-dependent NAD kinase
VSFVGIIANPESGRDIRRISGNAVTVSNQQKLNIIESLLVALSESGVERIEIMPERFSFGEQAKQSLSKNKKVQQATSIVPMEYQSENADSFKAAEYFIETGVHCIIVLGGDGTTRVVSKASGEIPLLPLSTGTNNVIPYFIDGTVAGLAAAFYVLHPEISKSMLCWRHKRLAIKINREEVDQALVDAALIFEPFVGAKAVWNVQSIKEVFVTRAHPLNIGISSLIGLIKPISPYEPEGAYALVNGNGHMIKSILLPGKLTPVQIGKIHSLVPDSGIQLQVDQPATISLDGEREVMLKPGDQVEIILKLDGPWLLDVEKTMLRAVSSTLLRI